MTGPLDRYTTISQDAAARVIAGYSTSFSMATRLLPKRSRTHVASVYALVRVADEIVDGVGEAAGLSLDQQRAALDALEADVESATASGFSTNLVVHAFAQAARASNIGTDLTGPFFHSMRMDLTPHQLSESEQLEYVHGSAEVVGLMCVRVFQAGSSVSARDAEVIDRGARALGSAFQNVNFLRDLADDTDLGRDYLPTGEQTLTERGKDEWVAKIRDDFALADAAIPLLPADCRAAVRAAAGLFTELTERIAKESLASLRSRRVSVPSVVKARIVSRSVIGERPWRR